MNRPRAGAGRRGVAVALGWLAPAVLLTGCEDQVKYVAWFATMTDQPSVETYQDEPLQPVAGTIPTDGWVEYSLLDADTALFNPLTATSETIARGDSLYRDFCLPCHGASALGDGPVVGPGRLPPTPIMNLTSDRARDLTDGYVWGIIGEGRGLMPSYRRIEPMDRWYVVTYLRELQQAAAAAAR